MRPRPNPLGCRHAWPVLCQIDCDKEPELYTLLSVGPGEEAQIGPGPQEYSCVVVEGRLRITGFAFIEAPVIVIGATGVIDGSGRGRSGGSDGGDGHSIHGRGSGGAGGSGVCRGGPSAELKDATEGAQPGRQDSNLEAAGASGGNGGDLQGLGGLGAAGGASLHLLAHRCVLSGRIDLSGGRGDTPMDSDGGGGGGGAAGNLQIACARAELHLQNLRLLANGGAGGDGGTTSDKEAIYTGGGGGGGAGGLMRLSFTAVELLTPMRSTEISSSAVLYQRLEGHISVRGGLGGEQGETGSPSERGRDGETCQVEVRVGP